MVNGVATMFRRVADRGAMSPPTDNLTASPVPMHRRLIESLYVEAMVLADEAYGCFAAERVSGEAGGDAATRIGYACESLKTTTRLMHIIAWLLNQRAVIAGEIRADADPAASALGDPVPVDWDVASRFAEPVQTLMVASERLFDRIAALNSAPRAAPAAPPPVVALQSALVRRF
jgi:regulator of CtrA degradation